MNGGHGQIVQQHVAKESKQEPEHVPMMLQILASHSLNKKLVKSKNAVMTLGLHGVTLIHVPIVVLVHINDNARDKGSFKFLRVHKKANRLKPRLKRRAVIIKAIGEEVSSKILSLKLNMN